MLQENKELIDLVSENLKLSKSSKNVLEIGIIIGTFIGGGNKEGIYLYLKSRFSNCIKHQERRELDD